MANRPQETIDNLSAYADLNPKQLSTKAIEKIAADIVKYMTRLTMLNDLIIKHLLGEPGKSEKRLKFFLNAFRIQTNQPLIEYVEIKECEIYPNSPFDKITYLDIKARDSTQTWYNIEVQLANHPHFNSRLLYYWAKLHSAQLKDGMDYDNIYPTICIVLTTFKLFPGLDEIFQSFHLSNDRHPEQVLTNDIQFYFLQLCGEINQERMQDLCTDLTDWIYFLSYPLTTEKQMSTALLNNPGVAETGEELTRFVCDDRQRAILEAREKTRRDLVDIELGGYLRGREEGRKEARFAGQIELILFFAEQQIQAPVPDRVRNLLNAIQSKEKLNELALRMRSVQTLADFEKLASEYAVANA